MNTSVKCQSLYIFVKGEVIAELLCQMHLDCASFPNEMICLTHVQLSSSRLTVDGGDTTDSTRHYTQLLLMEKPKGNVSSQV